MNISNNLRGKRKFSLLIITIYYYIYIIIYKIQGLGFKNLLRYLHYDFIEGSQTIPFLIKSDTAND